MQKGWCKWVSKTKRESNGNIELYKTRLLDKSFTQKDGIDYKKTFSPVSKKCSLIIIKQSIHELK